MNKSYESLWAEINRCVVCTNDTRIDPEIRDHWKRGAFVPIPGIGPEPSNLPVRYLLVAQEPSAIWTRGNIALAREKIANGLRNFNTSGGDFAIRWAAHNWLVNKGEEAFLITDLAKCSVTGNDVPGTMPRRYRNCHRFLNGEVEVFRSTLRAIIPVGNEAHRWCIAAAEPDWPPITKPVSHYARRFFSSEQQGRDKAKPLTDAEFADFMEFVQKCNPSRRIHDRERRILGIYKAQFAKIRSFLTDHG